MATKDPAILWYWNDYLGGTEGMTFEQQGAYVRLLNHQMDKGHLPLEFIRSILGAYFKKIWPVISRKFVLDPEGCYYNERVDEEKEKRANYLARQQKNGSKGGRPKKTHGLPEQNPRVMDGETHGLRVGSEWVNPNESTRDENENKDRESIEVSKVAKEKVVSLVPVEGTITGVKIETNLSKEEKKSFKKLSRAEFEEEVQHYTDRYPQLMIEDFIRYWSEPDDRGRMRFQKQDTWSTLGRLVTWNNNNKNKFYGSHQQTPTSAGPKPGTSAARIDTARNW